MTPPLFSTESFADRQGETFQVSTMAGPDTVELTLRRVTTWGGPEAPGNGRHFTLLFNGPLQPLLPQSIYQFEHPAMGAFEIFIVPVGPEGAAMQYEAVFS